MLAIDLGDVRVGLALSDPGRVIASPLDTLHVDEPGDVQGLADELARVAEEQDVGVFVVGLPRTLSGREGRPAQHARRVAARLAEVSGRDVYLWDERFTSAEAEKAMLAGDASRRRRRAAADRVAASLLLQAFLDSPTRGAVTLVEADDPGGGHGRDSPGGDGSPWR